MLIDISCRGLEATAASISDLQVAPKESDSAFVRPQSVLFSQDGKRRRWDMVITHPSVAIILYNTELDALVLVRQFRPAVYAAALGEAAKLAAAVKEGGNGGATTLAEAVPLSCAFVYELCAGIIDKPGLDLTGVAKEEVLEECGYEVPRDAFEKVTSCLTSVGISGAPQTVFYAEVTESMRVSKGGGSEKEGEAIDIVGLPTKLLATFAETEDFPKSAGLMFACLWLQNRLKQRGAA